MSTTQCNRCGKTLPEDSTDGTCPSCLLGWGLAAEESTVVGRGPVSKEAQLPQPAARFTCFGDYELVHEIDRGGMGVVYKARQVSLNRTVAVKMILAGQFASPDALQRFKTEASAAARLHHPRIVGIHEVGEHEGFHYFSMDYIEGQDLGQFSREQPVSPRQAAAWVKTIADAIHYAHEQGILHRDLKPSNILIDRSGQPHVTDFGLAKHLGEDSDMTLTGQILGSPNYMPPEQAQGQHRVVGRTGDIYSIGAILYQLLTGRPPFVAGTVAETLQCVLQGEVVSPRFLSPNTPVDLETICLKCLERDASRRYQSAQELTEELERFLADEPIQARPIGSLEKARRWCRRKPVVAGLGAGLVVVLLAGMAGIAWQLQRVNSKSEESRRQLAKLSVVTGAQLMQERDHFKALLWFCHALQSDATDANRAADHRTRIASVFAYSPKLVQLVSHDGLPVADAALSLRDDRLATVGADQTVRIWELPEGRTLVRTAPFQALPYAIAFSPDGLHLAVTLLNDTVLVLRTDTGDAIAPALPHQIQGAGNRPLLPAFDPSGRWLVTQPEVRRLQLVDVASGKPAGPGLPHPARIGGFQFSADGAVLFTRTSGSRNLRWETATGQLQPFPVDSPLRVHAFQVAPKGDLALVGNRVVHYRESRVQAVLQLDDAWIQTATFSPAADRILVTGRDRTTRVFDTTSGNPQTPFFGYGQLVRTALFSPDGARVLTFASDNTVTLWDSHSGQPLTSRIPWADGSERIGFSASGRYVATMHPGNLVAIWDTDIQLEPPALLKPQDALTTPSAQGDTFVLRQAYSPLRVQRLSQALEASLHPLSMRIDPRNAWPDVTGRLTVVEGAMATVQIWSSTSGLPLTPQVPSTYTLEDRQTTTVRLPKSELPMEDLIQLAELLSASRLDGSGGWTLLATDEIHARWQPLSTRYPNLFAPTDPDALAWHAGQAKAAQNAFDWHAAVFHAGRLFSARSNHPSAQTAYQYAQQALAHRLRTTNAGVQNTPIIPPRDPRAEPRCLDLTEYYTDPLAHRLPLGRTRTSFPQDCKRSAACPSTCGVPSLSSGRAHATAVTLEPPR